MVVVCRTFSLRRLGCVVISIVSISLFRTARVSAAKCTDLPVGIELKAQWWSIRPYASKATDAGTFTNENNTIVEGMFPEVFQELKNRTGINVKYSEPLPNYPNFTKTMGDDNQTLFFPIMKETDDEECFVPVMQTNGPAYFIRHKEISPLTLLGRGLLQGWQVIALTIVLAGISGIFMWLMDRHANPQDFPHAFFPGIWQGFWWAFVTMTTVGYGDTAPRSIPARLYSILWMIIGMIAFSVLTANITSSLSRQSFDAEEKLFGRKVGVLGGTLDATAALMENANVFEYDTKTELLASMKAGSVEGILLERFVAGAHYNTYKEEGLELGTMLTFPYYVGMQVPAYIPGHTGSHCKEIKKCVQDILKKDEIATKILSKLSKGWRSFQESQSSSLFEDESFFYILIAFFFALVGAGTLWHYFVFLPGIKETEEKDTAELEAGNNKTDKKFIILKHELEMLCVECREKVENVMKENPDRLENDALSALFPLHLATPNLKRLSNNAIGQLRNMPSNAVGQLSGLNQTPRKKSGRPI